MCVRGSCFRNRNERMPRRTRRKQEESNVAPETDAFRGEAPPTHPHSLCASEPRSTRHPAKPISELVSFLQQPFTHSILATSPLRCLLLSWVRGCPSDHHKNRALEERCQAGWGGRQETGRTGMENGCAGRMATRARLERGWEVGPVHRCDLSAASPVAGMGGHLVCLRQTRWWVGPWRP